ncbi:MAG: histidine kinase dimerization/phospho-acceptor domain-containing protein [Eubacterium sp.]
MQDKFNTMLSGLQNLEDARQEFVSNVSHELKTPITSIKVLAESLIGQEGLPVEIYQEFMVDINNELERMNKIINDLLSLEMENRPATG